MTKEHLITIKFKLPLVKDSPDYKDPDDKSKGYSVKKGNMDLEGKLPSVKKGRPSKIPTYTIIRLSQTWLDF